MNDKYKKVVLSAVEEEKGCHDIETEMKKIYPDLVEITMGTVSLLNGLKEELNRSSKHDIVDTISWRIKEPESIIAKLKRKEREISMESALSTLHDLIGIRIICYYQDDVYGLLEKLKTIKEFKIVKIKDYIHTPKSGGYRSIHVIIKYRSPQTGNIFGELQLRSVAMHYWACLEHQLQYKNGSKTAELREELKSYAVEIADIDKKFYQMRKKIEKLR